jgi:hypothetical protein
MDKQYELMTRDDRSKSFQALLVDLANNVEKLARCCRAMVDHGEEIVGITAQTKRLLLAVADGRLPTRFFYHPEARKVLAYSREEQETIFLDKPIEVLAADGTILMERPSKMPKETKKRVLGADHIRDDSEQRAWLEEERIHSNIKPSKETSIRETSKGIEIRLGNGIALLTWEDLAQRVTRRMVK